MSLQGIISGVTQGIGTVLTTAANLPIPASEASVRAVGAAYGSGYDDGFARLIVSLPQGGTLTVDSILLQSVAEDFKERVSPSYTLSNPALLSSGSDIQMFRYGGSILINQLDGDARQQFLNNYEKYLRASVTVGRGAAAEFSYRDQLRYGYIIGLEASQNSEFENVYDISFTMFVTAIRFKAVGRGTS